MSQKTRFDPPPEGFDPLIASDASLLRYGLPRRPDPATQPRLARLWQETLSRKTTFGMAELGEPFVRRHKAARTDKTPRPHEDISPADTPQPPLIQPGECAGVSIPVPANDSFQMAFGQWVVPTVAPNNPSGQELSLSFWVGLESSSPNTCGGQVLQAGVKAVVDSGGGGVTWQAWTEWWNCNYQIPARPVSNFPVAPGDSVGVLVCSPEPTIGYVTFINLSHYPQVNKIVSPIAAPDGMPLTGAYPTWAVEPAAPTATPTPNSELLYFYEWEVRNCVASTPSQLYDLSTATTNDIYIPVTGDYLTATKIETPMSAVVHWLAFNCIKC